MLHYKTARPQTEHNTILAHTNTEMFKCNVAIIPGLYARLSSPAPNSPGESDLCCDQGKDETSNNDEDCVLPD